MDSDNKNIAQLFGNSFFRIPTYQRGYAWGKSQLDDFWEDLLDIVEKGSVTGKFHPHFTGTISLKEMRPKDLTVLEQEATEEGYEFYDVVDGQQRLTTISILLYVLIRRIGGDKMNRRINSFIYNGDNIKIYKLAYGKSTIANDNNEYLQNSIFNEKVSSSTIENKYTHNLHDAKEYFEEKVRSLNEEKLKTVYRVLCNEVRFDRKIIDSNYDVQVVFETMNNRGKPLSTLEKLKNRLMFLAVKLNIKEGEAIQLSENINKSWSKIYEWLGKNSEAMLDEDDYVSAHLTLCRVPADYSFSKEQSNQKVFEMFCEHPEKYKKSYARGASVDEKEEEISFNKIDDYTKDLVDMIEFWYKVDDISRGNKSDEIDLLVYKILLLNGTKEMKVFLMQLLKMKSTQFAEVKECLELVLKIVMRNRIPGAALMDERTFAAKSRDLHLKEKTLTSVIEDLENSTLKSCDKVVVVNGFKGLFGYVRGNIGFYRWNAIKFFLFLYEESLVPRKDKPRIRWEDYTETSIEHIMPKTWEDKWENEMDSYLSDKELDEDDTKKAQNIIINTLGNLSIIFYTKNPSLSNDGWIDKRTHYEHGCYSEQEVSKNPNWGYQEIYNRGKKMLKILCRTMLDNKLQLEEEDYKDILFYSEKFQK